MDMTVENHSQKTGLRVYLNDMEETKSANS